MTVGEVIGEVDKLMPNVIDNQIKIAWLCRLDRQIQDEIVETHEKPEGYTEPDFKNYDMNTELIVDEIHVDLYMAYLKMRISLEQVESERYAMEHVNYNNMYITFRDYYNRKHKAIRKSVPKYR